MITQTVSYHISAETTMRLWCLCLATLRGISRYISFVPVFALISISILAVGLFMGETLHKFNLFETIRIGIWKNEQPNR